MRSLARVNHYVEIMQMSAPNGKSTITVIAAMLIVVTSGDLDSTAFQQ